MPPKSKKSESASVASPTISTPSKSQSLQWDRVVSDVVSHYVKTTPQRTKLIDMFMAYIAVVGALQFLYCLIAGNFPFNAFLSGFGSTVAQFVLTASLRVQTTASNKQDFPSISPERAFADYIFCSLILQFFVVNFIN
ncbi:hypothetical protein VUR80DRAFT_4384 [Thermomyces stellatus]